MHNATARGGKAYEQNKKNPDPATGARRNG